MKKISFILSLLMLFTGTMQGQFIYKIKADSVLITNDSCSSELNLENSTKNVLGFLYNYGNGRTKFVKGLLKLNDSVYMIGPDTLKLATFGGNYIKNQSIQQASSNFNISGNGIIGGKTRIGGGILDGTNTLQVNGTSLLTGDANINGITVGKGPGSLSANTVVGVNSMAANSTGNYNTAQGYGTLAANTTGGSNTALDMLHYLPIQLAPIIPPWEQIHLTKILPAYLIQEWAILHFKVTPRGQTIPPVVLIH
jgi:hypothetical protein